MSIKFEFYETPDPSGEKTGKYHARAVTRVTVDTEQLISEIHESTTLSPADIKAALTALSDKLILHLGRSERVHMEGIGFFQPTLTYKRDIEPDKTRSQSVWFKSVKYRADIKVKEGLKYVHTKRSKVKRHSANLSTEDIDNRLTVFFREYNMLARRQLEELCNMTRITANRHMKRLIDEGKIKNIGLPKQPIYVPVPGNYGIE